MGPSLGSSSIKPNFPELNRAFLAKICIKTLIFGKIWSKIVGLDKARLFIWPGSIKLEL
jgi:hypothetical protein